jgi:hypothetical protein
MMGQWQDVRTPNGRLLCRIDAERRLLEFARKGNEVIIDLDVWLLGVAEIEKERNGLAGLGAIDEDTLTENTAY